MSKPAHPCTVILAATPITPIKPGKMRLSFFILSKESDSALKKVIGTVARFLGVDCKNENEMLIMLGRIKLKEINTLLMENGMEGIPN